MTGSKFENTTRSELALKLDRLSVVALRVKREMKATNPANFAELGQSLSAEIDKMREELIGWADALKGDF